MPKLATGTADGYPLSASPSISMLPVRNICLYTTMLQLCIRQTQQNHKSGHNSKTWRQASPKTSANVWQYELDWYGSWPEGLCRLINWLGGGGIKAANKTSAKSALKLYISYKMFTNKQTGEIINPSSGRASCYLLSFNLSNLWLCMFLDTNLQRHNLYDNTININCGKDVYRYRER